MEKTCSSPSRRQLFLGSTAIPCSSGKHTITTDLRLLLANHAFTLSSFFKSLVVQLPRLSRCSARSILNTDSLRPTNEMTSIVHLPEGLVKKIACYLSSDDKFSLRLTCRALRPTNQTTNIVQLPEELVQNIACYLGSDDKFSLRLTCRALERKSLHEFASKHFTRKCVQLTTDSLQVLVDISKSRLGKYVRDVSVIAALFTDLCFTRSSLQSAAWKPNAHQKVAYRNYVRDQTSLRRSGGDLAMIVEAFSLFPKLKMVALVDSEDRLRVGTDYRGGRTVPRLTGQCCCQKPGLARRITFADLR